MNVNLFGKRIFADVIKLRVLRYHLWWAMMSFPTRKEEKHTENRPCEERQRRGLCFHQPKNAWSHGKLEERQRVGCPLEPPEGTVLPTLWFQTSGLQNCERINICCFQSFMLWWLVTVALENEYKTYLILGSELFQCYLCWGKQRKPGRVGGSLFKERMLLLYSEGKAGILFRLIERHDHFGQQRAGIWLTKLSSLCESTGSFRFLAREAN